MTSEQRLADPGCVLRDLPEGPPEPYESLVQIGGVAYGSGNASMDRHAGRVFRGKLGADIDVEEAHECARIAMVNAIMAFKPRLGTLHRSRRFVRLTGCVNSAPEFKRHAAVETIIEVDGS